MARKPTIRTVLFDMDDTLIDWSQTPIHAWREHERNCLRRVWRWLAKHGPVPPHPQLEEVYLNEMYATWRQGKRKLVAPHLADILTHTLHKVGIEDERCDRDALLAAYGDQPPPGLRVFPDVIPTLNTLQGRGVRFGLITNASHPMSLRDETLRSHGLLEFFPECRISAADVGYLKPHRAIFEHAMASSRSGQRKPSTSATIWSLISTAPRKWASSRYGARGRVRTSLRKIRRCFPSPLTSSSIRWRSCCRSGKRARES